MTFTFTAAVAWDPIGKQAVKNVRFQVYATTDTGYTTPLAITDPNSVAIPGNILNSGSQGVFPQFNQATNSAVVITDPAHTYAWTINCVPTDAAVANFISAPGSATATQLSATYAPVSGSGVYAQNAALNLSSANLRRARAALGKASTATGPARVLFVGDSITAGTGSTGSISTGSLPARLQALLVGAGMIDGGTGRVWPAHNVTPTPSPADSRWTFTGFTPAAAGTSNYVTATTNGATATFVSDKPGTIVDIYWTVSSGAFTYAIDGAAPVAVAAGAPGATTWTGATVTGLADTTHTVVITTTSTTAVNLGAIAVRRVNGVAVENAGNGGALSSTWIPTAAWNSNGPTVKASSNDSHLILVESTLVNDGQNGVTAATHQANMLAILNDWKTVGDVVLWIPPASDTALVSAAIFASLRQAAYDAAAAAGVPVLDISTRWGSFVTANGLGYMSDAAHPTSAGYDDIARAFAAMLSTPGGSRPGDTAWTAASLVNGWVNYGAPFGNARYRKDSNGFVHLSGLIKSGTATGGTILFTVPSGYRPLSTEAFPVTSVEAFGEVWVGGDGTVKIQAGSATWFSLSGVTFLAEN